MNLILISLAVLGVTGLVAAVLLYLIAQKFKVEEDPRIDEVQEALPGANCGGCGFAGCRALAEACVKAAFSFSVSARTCEGIRKHAFWHSLRKSLFL